MTVAFTGEEVGEDVDGQAVTGVITGNVAQAGGAVERFAVVLAGAGVAVRGKSAKSMAHEADVNGDGLVDLVCQLETENLTPESFQHGSAILTGQTFDGQNIQGEDEITIVRPEK